MLPAGFLSSNRAATKGAQLADALRDVLSVAIQEEIRDQIVTVVSVSLSLDKRIATVWIRTYPMDNAGSTVRKLQKRAGYFRHRILEHMQRRMVPELQFSVDTNPEASAALDQLLSGH
jgi:ribosome-binding factor A